MCKDLIFLPTLAGCKASVRGILQGTKNMLCESFFWQRATKATKVTYHQACQAPKCPLLCTQPRAARKGPQYGTMKTQQQCLQPQWTDHPRKSYCTFPHLHNHSALDLWPTCRRNAGWDHCTVHGGLQDTSM